MAAAHVFRAESRSRRRAPRQGLDENIGVRENAPQERLVGVVLDVEDEGFLAPAEPDEIAALPPGGAIVAPGEIALGPLDLDDPGAGVGAGRA